MTTKHGGPRSGAGRPPKSTDRPRQIYIEPADAMLLDLLRGELSMKAFISALIRREVEGRKG